MIHWAKGTEVFQTRSSKVFRWVVFTLEGEMEGYRGPMMGFTNLLRKAHLTQRVGDHC
jgi:hypothetical protein